jgi:hypothetical protein
MSTVANETTLARDFLIELRLPWVQATIATLKKKGPTTKDLVKQLATRLQRKIEGEIADGHSPHDLKHALIAAGQAKIDYQTLAKSVLDTIKKAGNS